MLKLFIRLDLMSQGRLTLDLVDLEDDVLMDFLMHGQFSSLAECPIATFEIALERFLLCVDVHVLL